MTLLWCTHVYKFSHRFRNCELFEWSVREAARHAAESRLPRLDRAAREHSQTLRSGSSTVPSRLHKMRTLLAPVSTAQAWLIDAGLLHSSRKHSPHARMRVPIRHVLNRSPSLSW